MTAAAANHDVFISTLFQAFIYPSCIDLTPQVTAWTTFAIQRAMDQCRTAVVHDAMGAGRTPRYDLTFDDLGVARRAAAPAVR